jgi:two-component system NarL family response regulator
MIRLLLADDHPIIRLAIRKLVGTQPDMCVVAEASNGPAAVRLFAEQTPDVSLLDLRMPGGDAPEAITEIRKLNPDARTIVLTTYDADEDIYRAVQAGACGYLLKATFAEGVLDAIRSVHAGHHLFPGAVGARLKGHPRGSQLTGRESAVLALVARGFTNREIETALSMAEGTLRNHLKHIFDKLQVTSRTEAAMAAIRRGIIRL